MPENHCFNQVRALKRGSNTHEAQNILYRLAALVKPIMTKRGWFVKALSEFYPKDRYLLGININKTLEIKIRLRKPANYESFLVFEDMLGTLLHELVHIIRAPHDSEFNRILVELKQEMAKLILKGYRGDGFHSEGKRLSAQANDPTRMIRISNLLDYNDEKSVSKTVPFSGRSNKLGSTFKGKSSTLFVSASSLTKQKMAAAAEARYLSNLKRNDKSRCANASGSGISSSIKAKMANAVEARLRENLEIVEGKPIKPQIIPSKGPSARNALLDEQALASNSLASQAPTRVQPTLRATLPKSDKTKKDFSKSMTGIRIVSHPQPIYIINLEEENSSKDQTRYKQDHQKVDLLATKRGTEKNPIIIID